MRKNKIILLAVTALLFTGCATKPHCHETDREVVATKMNECVGEWMQANKSEIGLVPDSRITTNQIELIYFHCKAKANDKACE